MPDYSIAIQNTSPQIQTPNELMTNAYAMQNARQANELNMLKMSEYKSGLAEQDKIKNELALAQSPKDVVNVLTKYGKTKEAADYAYRTAKTSKLGAETTNLGYTGQKTQVEAAAKKQDMVQSMMRDLSTRPSDANIMAHAEDIAASPLFTPEEKAAVKRRAADLLAKPIDQRVPDLASAGASASDLKPNVQMQNLGGTSNVLSVPAYGGAPTILSTTPMGISPNTTATISAAAEQGRLNRANAEKVAKLRNSGDLTPEQNDALYGPNGAVTLGKLDPYKINSRNSHILANAYLGNPNMDMNKLASDSAMMRNAPTMNRAYTTEQLPTIISNVVEAGKKVNYSDNKYFGKVQEYINGASNDPDFINYMTQRNDALLTITSIMRGNGATDQAHRAEIEASPSTMSPRAFDAWAAGQMKALEPRIKQANKFTRSTPAAPASPATTANPHANKTDAQIKAELGL
jgi:hypothetical protein